MKRQTRQVLAARRRAVGTPHTDPIIQAAIASHLSIPLCPLRGGAPQT